MSSFFSTKKNNQNSSTSGGNLTNCRSSSSLQSGNSVNASNNNNNNNNTPSRGNSANGSQRSSKVMSPSNSLQVLSGNNSFAGSVNSLLPADNVNSNNSLKKRLLQSSVNELIASATAASLSHKSSSSRESEISGSAPIIVSANSITSNYLNDARNDNNISGSLNYTNGSNYAVASANNAKDPERASLNISVVQLSNNAPATGSGNPPFRSSFTSSSTNIPPSTPPIIASSSPHSSALLLTNTSNVKRRSFLSSFLGDNANDSSSSSILSHNSLGNNGTSIQHHASLNMVNVNTVKDSVNSNNPFHTWTSNLVPVFIDDLLPQLMGSGGNPSPIVSGSNSPVSSKRHHSSKGSRNHLPSTRRHKKVSKDLASVLKVKPEYRILFELEKTVGSNSKKGSSGAEESSSSYKIVFSNKNLMNALGYDESVDDFASIIDEDEKEFWIKLLEGQCNSCSSFSVCVECHFRQSNGMYADVILEGFIIPKNIKSPSTGFYSLWSGYIRALDICKPSSLDYFLNGSKNCTTGPPCASTDNLSGNNTSATATSVNCRICEKAIPVSLFQDHSEVCATYAKCEESFEEIGAQLAALYLLITGRVEELNCELDELLKIVSEWDKTNSGNAQTFSNFNDSSTISSLNMRELIADDDLYQLLANANGNASNNNANDKSTASSTSLNTDSASFLVLASEKENSDEQQNSLNQQAQQSPEGEDKFSVNLLQNSLLIEEIRNLTIPRLKKTLSLACQLQAVAAAIIDRDLLNNREAESITSLDGSLNFQAESEEGEEMMSIQDQDQDHKSNTALMNSEDELGESISSSSSSFTNNPSSAANVINAATLSDPIPTSSYFYPSTTTRSNTVSSFEGRDSVQFFPPLFEEEQTTTVNSNNDIASSNAGNFNHSFSGSSSSSSLIHLHLSSNSLNNNTNNTVNPNYHYNGPVKKASISASSNANTESFNSPFSGATTGVPLFMSPPGVGAIMIGGSRKSSSVRRRPSSSLRNEEVLFVPDDDDDEEENEEGKEKQQKEERVKEGDLLEVSLDKRPSSAKKKSFNGIEATELEVVAENEGVLTPQKSEGSGKTNGSGGEEPETALIYQESVEVDVSSHHSGLVQHSMSPPSSASPVPQHSDDQDSNRNNQMGSTNNNEMTANNNVGNLNDLDNVNGTSNGNPLSISKLLAWQCPQTDEMLEAGLQETGLALEQLLYDKIKIMKEAREANRKLQLVNFTAARTRPTTVVQQSLGNYLGFICNSSSSNNGNNSALDFEINFNNNINYATASNNSSSTNPSSPVIRRVSSPTNNNNVNQSLIGANNALQINLPVLGNSQMNLSYNNILQSSFNNLFISNSNANANSNANQSNINASNAAISGGAGGGGSSGVGVSDFEIIKPISKGAYGRVYLTRKRKTGDVFALKVLSKSDMIARNQLSQIIAEQNILTRLDSPFIVKMYYSFQSKNNLYLVLEYLNGGDCSSLLKAVGRLDENWARVYLAEIVMALEAVHKKGIIHRDLKPDNFLIDSRGHIKITDFGLSRMNIYNHNNNSNNEEDSFPNASSTVFSASSPPSSPQSRRNTNNTSANPFQSAANGNASPNGNNNNNSPVIISRNSIVQSVSGANLNVELLLGRRASAISISRVASSSGMSPLHHSPSNGSVTGTTVTTVNANSNTTANTAVVNNPNSFNMVGGPGSPKLSNASNTGNGLFNGLLSERRHSIIGSTAHNSNNNSMTNSNTSTANNSNNFTSGFHYTSPVINNSLFVLPHDTSNISSSPISNSNSINNLPQPQPLPSRRLTITTNIGSPLSSPITLFSNANMLSGNNSSPTSSSSVVSAAAALIARRISTNVGQSSPLRGGSSNLTTSSPASKSGSIFLMGMDNNTTISTNSASSYLNISSANNNNNSPGEMSESSSPIHFSSNTDEHDYYYNYSNNNNSQPHQLVGTPDYMAPEVIMVQQQQQQGSPSSSSSFKQNKDTQISFSSSNSANPYNPLVDYWSLGAIAFEFLFGLPPFHDDEPEKIFANILARKFSSLMMTEEDDGENDFHNLPSDQEFLDRFGISKSARDLIDQLLVLDPSQRLGAIIGSSSASAGAIGVSADLVKEHEFFREIREQCGGGVDEEGNIIVGNWETLCERDGVFVPQTEAIDDTAYFDDRGVLNDQESGKNPLEEEEEEEQKACDLREREAKERENERTSSSEEENTNNNIPFDDMPAMYENDTNTNGEGDDKVMTGASMSHSFSSGGGGAMGASNSTFTISNSNNNSNNAAAANLITNNGLLVRALRNSSIQFSSFDSFAYRNVSLLEKANNELLKEKLFNLTSNTSNNNTSNSSSNSVNINSSSVNAAATTINTSIGSNSMLNSGGAASGSNRRLSRMSFSNANAFVSPPNNSPENSSTRANYSLLKGLFSPLPPNIPSTSLTTTITVNILLVLDNNPVSQLMLESLLRKRISLLDQKNAVSVNVVSVKDGRQALRMLLQGASQSEAGQCKFDLVFMDVQGVTSFGGDIIARLIKHGYTRNNCALSCTLIGLLPAHYFNNPGTTAADGSTSVSSASSNTTAIPTTTQQHLLYTNIGSPTIKFHNSHSGAANNKSSGRGVVAATSNAPPKSSNTNLNGGKGVVPAFTFAFDCLLMKPVSKEALDLVLERYII